jgi:hypothetical protein
MSEEEKDLLARIGQLAGTYLAFYCPTVLYFATNGSQAKSTDTKVNRLRPQPVTNRMATRVRPGYMQRAVMVLT